MNDVEGDKLYAVHINKSSQNGFILLHLEWSIGVFHRFQQETTSKILSVENPTKYVIISKVGASIC